MIVSKWHYTTGYHFKLIARSRVIRLATAGVPVSEKPVVWFSTNSVWEATCNGAKVVGGKHQKMTRDETAEHSHGLVRIGIEDKIAPHDWKSFKALSGASGSTTSGLYRAALENGARPGEWFVSFQPVTEDQWRTVEYWDGAAWRMSDEEFRSRIDFIVEDAIVNKDGQIRRI